MTSTGIPQDSATAPPQPNDSSLMARNALMTRTFPNDFSLQMPPPGGPGDNQPAADSTGGIIRALKRRQGVFVLTFAVVTSALALNTLRERIFSPVYRGGFQIQISNPFDQAQARSSGGANVGDIARTAPRQDVPSLIVLMRSPLLLRPVALKQGVTSKAIANGLNISPAGVEEILDVKLRWKDPVKARSILNDLAKEYTKFSITERQASIDSGVEFLDQQAPDLEKRVEVLQAALRNFRIKNKFLEPTGVASSIQGTRDGLIQQLRALQTRKVQVESRIASVRSGRLDWLPSGAPTAVEQMGELTTAIPGRGAEPAAAAGSDTPSGQLQSFEQQLATARATFREDSPVIQAIKAKRDEMMPVVQKQAIDSLLSQLLDIASQEDEINRQILLLNKNFTKSPRLMEEYDEISSALSSARASYASFIQSRERFRLERARFTTPWQVIAPPEVSDVPVSPNLQTSMLRAIMFGLLAGLGAAILREKTDNVFHTPMEAEKDLQLPVLGLIPHLPLEPGFEISNSISKMSASERFAIKESLRSLFTTFRLLRADRNIRLVGITSSTQGEGKSTAVSIFARTLADLGLNVLIIDSDMRLPMQSKYLGIERGDGLSTMLSDSSVNPTDLIQNIQDNLDVIPAGPKPPDPAKLLNSRRCQDVINEIRSLDQYDIILFDAPPCLMLADPILLGEKLDGILFLVGLGKVSRQLAPQACRRIKATGVDVLGMICNQVSFPTRLNDYGYEYGYYYHYAYAGSYGNKYGDTYSKSSKLSNYIRRRYEDTYVNSGTKNYYGTYSQAEHGKISVANQESTDTPSSSQALRSLNSTNDGDHLSLNKLKIPQSGKDNIIKSLLSNFKSLFKRN